VFWQMDLYKGFQRHEPKPKPFATEIARKGRWKLLAKDGVPVELIDLDANPGETVNLLDEHPAIVKELAAELHAWLAAPRHGWEESTF
jgi:arylsulfatase A